MGYSQENGYIPVDVATIMADIMAEINTQFSTTYTMETFVGTGFYKTFYALAQKAQANEVKTSEIFQKLQQYFVVINAMISRPTVTNPGIVEKIKAEGFIASLKPMIEADRGKINVCVDLDADDPDYASKKLFICTLVSTITAGGCVTQGAESQSIVLPNGQAFDFKYHLPTRIPVWLRLTITLSENNQLVIGDPDDTKLLLMTNIAEEYQLGKNFEPQRYFQISDAPWGASVLLEWTDDVTETSPGSGVYTLDGGAVWNTTVFNSDFDEIFNYALERLTLVEA